MAKLTLNELRQEMEARGIHWAAEVTSVTDKLVKGDERRLGLAISESKKAQLLAEANRTQIASVQPPPPASFDWRNHLGKNWDTKVNDQGSCGSCVSFATCASLEVRARIRAENAGMQIDLSEAHLFYCGAGLACDIGWEFEQALTFCRSTGVGKEADFPYSPGNQACQNIPPVQKVSSWVKVGRNLDRRTAIANDGPVIAGMRVFDDLSYYRGGIYRHLIGDFLGLHAVCVVGYDDPGRFWIVKNSWGIGWGESGYMKIAYGECGLDSEFPFFSAKVVATSAPVV